MAEPVRIIANARPNRTDEDDSNVLTVPDFSQAALVIARRPREVPVLGAAKAVRWRVTARAQYLGKDGTFGSWNPNGYQGIALPAYPPAFDDTGENLELLIGPVGATPTAVAVAYWPVTVPRFRFEFRFDGRADQPWTLDVWAQPIPVSQGLYGLYGLPIVPRAGAS